MDILTNNWVEWSALGLTLGGLTYGAFAIKREDETAFENSQSFSLGQFLLEVPRWWSLTEKSDDQLHFERTDTRYDWFAKFFLLTECPLETQEQLVEWIRDFFRKEGIELDQHQSDITEFQHRFSDAGLAKKVKMAYRFEGTASKNIEERIYLDLAIVSLQDGQSLCAYGLSSVLNGSVEGPFFEKVLYRLKV